MYRVRRKPTRYSSRGGSSAAATSKKYLYFAEPKVWGDARATCKNLGVGADLVTFDSAAEEAYVTRVVLLQGMSSAAAAGIPSTAAWIGCNNLGVEGEWVWASSGHPCGPQRNGMYGRYVVIELEPLGIINLREVEAFNSHGNRIAPVNAVMSSTYASANSASACIDQVISPDDDSSLCHNADGDASPYLRIDYGKSVQIAKIVVSNRIKCKPRCTSRIIGARISVQSTQSFLLWSSRFIGDFSDYTFTTTSTTATTLWPTGGTIQLLSGGTTCTEHARDPFWGG